VLGKQRAERVRLALDRLPGPQRVVVHLHRFEGLGFAEIGKVLGITEGAAKLRAFRAYEQLRTLLSDLVAEDPS
jgi:RNA polymerase sigma-70 factor (ECF subfamily)